MAAFNTNPTYLAGSFTCPHCGANCQQNWASCSATMHDDTMSEFDPDLKVSTCFVCEQQSVWLVQWQTYSGSVGRYREGKLIFPVAERFGPERSPDMPKNVATLYDEASTIADLSPRAACGLLRLALELLLSGLYPDEKDLNSMIGAAAKAGVPQQVVKIMDITRFSGNQNVHELHPDDSAANAATLFGLLNVVVERLITEPKTLDGLYKGLPDSLKEQIKKRDGL